MLNFVFEDGFGFETYARYALDVPMYFVKRNGTYIDAAGQSFRAFIDGELPAAPGVQANLHDWEEHLATLFPEVRLKTFLEMRGADQREQLRLDAPWIGLRAQVGKRSARDIAVDILAIAREGLKRRARIGAALTDERGYLAELEEIADSGITPAERWLDHYNGAWHGEVSPVFEAAAY